VLFYRFAFGYIEALKIPRLEAPDAIVMFHSGAIPAQV